MAEVETIVDKSNPDQVIAALMSGNDRFASGKSTQRNWLSEVEATSAGQSPMAAVLGCIDSRVPPEVVFDTGLGEIFAARVAGNFADTNIIGSFEFATHVAGACVIMVLGHTSCGAVSAACRGVRLGNLSSALDQITPAVDESIEKLGRGYVEDELIQATTRTNVERTMQSLTERSDILRDLVASEALKIIGGIYDLSTGRVTLLENA